MTHPDTVTIRLKEVESDFKPRSNEKVFSVCWVFFELKYFEIDISYLHVINVGRQKEVTDLLRLSGGNHYKSEDKDSVSLLFSNQNFIIKRTGSHSETSSS